MSASFTVLRSHLKAACDNRDWDLLDKLLEMDRSAIDDNSMYTDTWGEWWGMLSECVRKKQKQGVHVLLSRGANPDLESWGDCIPTSPKAMAMNDPNLAPLFSEGIECYKRETEPELPKTALTEFDRQGELRDKHGFFFQSD
jgi:hypothetical protein